jgi:hypothetical protein
LSRLRLFGLAVWACLAALSLGTGASAAPAQHTISAGEGTVTATLSYGGAHEEPGTGPVPGLRLTIDRAGVQFYDAPVTSHYCGSPCGLEHFAGGPLLVRNLEGTGEPNVVVELNTGGAHCCTIVQVFAYDPGAMVYRSTERDLGDPGAVIRSVANDGTLQLETADDRFADAFAPFAYSGLPLQILAFREGRFRDVTRMFPAWVAADAAKWMKGFRAERRHGLGNGLIAAWAADEDLLGHDREMRATLAREAARDDLRSRGGFEPSGRTFVRRLLAFLARTGYRR